MKLVDLNNHTLFKNLAVSRKQERLSTLEVLAYISEVDKRRIYLELGYSSMFVFCRDKLGYSEPAALRRIKAARCMRRVPRVYKLLRDGELALGAVCLLEGIITVGNAEEVLGRAKGKTYREIEAVVASYRPESELNRDKIKPVTVFKACSFVAKDSAGSELKGGSAVVGMPLQESGTISLRIRQSVYTGEQPVVVAEQKLRFEFTGSEAFAEKVGRAKELLSGKYPEGTSLEQVFEAALDEFIARKTPKVSKVRTKKGKRKARGGSSGGRYVPQGIRAQVLKRDEFQCSFVGKSGKRCGARHDLEIDHLQPVSLGGKSELGNLRTLCRAHNLFEAKRVMGARFVEGKIRV